MRKEVRVRFAPSPTGGLHMGGIRTVLYNYLFAKKNQGDFILRIEDTDQNRYVPGAEEYIYDTLKWLELEPDESPVHGGKYGPYRQSERKNIYRKYAEQLVKDGYAYYAFDSPEDLDKMRHHVSDDRNTSLQYDSNIRYRMRNSLTISPEETNKLLEDNSGYVIRIKMPAEETISFIDMIRGEISFDSSLIDDKVLLKADGMPTYHLAVVVDDFLMKITHAFRGEEWLPSAPVHILLWKYLGWEKDIPEWAHLPLILGPEGKLSKRDSLKYGFPVFARSWTDPVKGETSEGFKEKGFVPEAFINLLALLGWNDGTEKEIFSLEELIEKFEIEKVHKGGAHFDYEKAKWFNHEWLKKSGAGSLESGVRELLIEKGFTDIDSGKLRKVIELVKDRCTLLPDFYDQSYFFFQTPEKIDSASILPKWSDQKQLFFRELIRASKLEIIWKADEIEKNLKEMAAAHQLKPGELMLPLRIMLVGGKHGPGVFDIAEIIGREETILRISNGLTFLSR